MTPAENMLIDAHGRRIEYLRVSVTDRCSLNCMYCGRSDGKSLEPHDLMTDEEILRIVRVAVGMGISKVRLTGGEPLCREGVEDIARSLSSMPGLDDLSLTTNGLLLESKSEALYAAGLRRINVSLDTLRPDRFQAVCRGGDVEAVLRGIAAARRVGLAPIKINVVVIRDTNHDELRDFVEFAAIGDTIVRFIEYMPIRTNDSWKSRYVSRDEMLAELKPLLSDFDPPHHASDPAQYFPLLAGGAVGLISPVSHGFCDRCNRLRVTPDGALQTCLLSSHREDLAVAMRAGESDDDLARRIRDAVGRKGREGDFAAANRSMRNVGG